MKFNWVTVTDDGTITINDGKLRAIARGAATSDEVFFCRMLVEILEARDRGQLVVTNRPLHIQAAQPSRYTEKTLRDEFAMAAVQGLMGSGGYSSEGAAQTAYQVADAMLRARIR